MMTFVEEYHEESGQTFTIPEFEFEEGEEIDGFLARQRPAIIRALSVSIELIVDLELDSIPVFTVRETGLIFNLDREAAEQSLDNCIEYFQEIEDYEKCARLLTLKSRL